MTAPRDWDKEMAEIDKLLAKGPAPAASNVPAPQGRDARPAPAVPPSTGVVTRGHHIAGVWVRALLGVAAAAALPFWPYAKSCGTMLYLYLLSTFAVIIVGAWTMRYAWTHRRGVAHVAGLFVLLAGITFAAVEILQRTTFAAVHLGWTCP
jgi:hypothetical protein